MWCKVASTEIKAEIQTCDRHPDTAGSGKTIRDYFRFAEIPIL